MIAYTKKSYVTIPGLNINFRLKSFLSRYEKLAASRKKRRRFVPLSTVVANINAAIRETSQAALGFSHRPTRIHYYITLRTETINLNDTHHINRSERASALRFRSSAISERGRWFTRARARARTKG